MIHHETLVYDTHVTLQSISLNGVVHVEAHLNETLQKHSLFWLILPCTKPEEWTPPPSFSFPNSQMTYNILIWHAYNTPNPKMPTFLRVWYYQSGRTWENWTIAFLSSWSLDQVKKYYSDDFLWGLLCNSFLVKRWNYQNHLDWSSVYVLVI